MNYNHWLSSSAGGGSGQADCFRNSGDMGSLRLGGQKRSHEQQDDNQLSAQEVFTQRRPKTNSFTGTSFPGVRPNMMFPIPEAENHHPNQNENILGGAVELLNHPYSPGFPSLPKFSLMRNESGILDSRFTKAMHPSFGNCRRNSVEEGGASMRQAKFTLMGEQIERSSSDEFHNTTVLPHLPYSNPQSMFALGPYFYEAEYNSANMSSDRLIAPIVSNPRPRGFYQSFSDVRAAACQKVGNHAESSTLLSFKSSKAAMQETLRRHIKSHSEPGTSRVGFQPGGTLKKKDKDNSSIFPANVKSLLSTGIFDGVPVKYVSWDRSKFIRGTIQGTGYLCWCANCNKTKTVNAYQLEQHAGSKSKHPNDHIYFSNGKSIYGVVQELKNTPSDKLLEVIPTVTGSGINDANFFKWKESFQAASRELQRIFGAEAAEASSARE